MDLFLETSAQRARRLAAGDGAAVSGFSGLWSGADAVASPCETPKARERAETAGGTTVAEGTTALAAPGRRGIFSRRKEKTPAAHEEYSIQQESYRAELAFDRARERRRKFLAVLRALAMVVLVPLGLVLLFVGSYSLTCILHGATPDEVVELLQMMFERVCSFAASLGWPTL